MIDTQVLWMRTEAAMRANRFAEALENLRQLIRVVNRIDFEYEEWLRAMVECLRAEQRWSEAAACSAYLGSTEAPSPEALRKLVDAVSAGDERATQELRLYATYLSRGGHHEAASGWFRAARMPVHQAIELERAGDDAAAAALWVELLERDSFAAASYERALVRINYGLNLLRRGEDSAHGVLAAATAALEAVAEEFETRGLRERAFDCYHLLARIGQETGTFENVAEGYLNSIRILTDDGLKLDALRLYEGLGALARKAEEWHAAASVLREAADFCLRRGLQYSDDLRLRSAEAWLDAAKHASDAGHPFQIVENALLAAAEGFASVRAMRRVVDVYRKLSEMDLPHNGQERYRRLVERLGDRLQDAPRPLPVPEESKELPDYEEVWYVDLAEWEIAGDPMLTAAGVMADRRFPDFVRRHALLLLLELERREEGMPPTDIVLALKAIRAYPVIACLERLFESEDADVRELVAKAMSDLRFKRSFHVVVRALRDPQPRVRDAARTATERLFFPHAFEPLRRIYNSRDLPEAGACRSAAVQAIGRINTVEALEFLCERLCDADQDHFRSAATAFAEIDNPELLPYLRQYYDLVPSGRRTVIDDAMRRLSEHAR